MHKSIVMLFRTLLFGCCLLGGVTHAASGFLYVLNNNPAGNNIYGYAVNETTGALTLLTGFPVATDGNGSTINASEQLVLDRLNARLYAINSGSNTISAYSADPLTGALTALPFSPIALSTGLWYSLAVHPSGSPLVIGEATAGSLLSFAITPTSATPAPGGPVLTGSASFSTAFSRNGKFVYTGGNNNGNQFLAAFQVSAAGVLSALAGSPYDFGDLYPVGYATDSSGRLFTSYFNSGQLRAFTTPAGIPTQVTGNAFTSGLSKPTHGVLHQNGYYMVADRFGDQVGVYQIAGSGSATTLAPVAGSPFSTGGTAAIALALDNTGTLLFAANATSLNIAGFSVAPATGVLSPAGLQPVNTVGTTGKLSGLAFLPPPADLVVTVSDSPHSVVAGSGPGNLTYTVTLENVGGTTANAVEVINTQTLPTGVSFDSATTATGTFDSDTGIWSIGNFAAGAKATLTITNTVSGSTVTGNNVINDTATVSSRDTQSNAANGRATQSTNVVSVITSGPTATPNPGGVNQPITFTVVTAGSGLTYDWTFGDGSTGTGPSVQHPYGATGTYTVTVTVSSAGNSPQMASVQVTIIDPLVGSGSDSDGDGFSDSFETFAGTDSANAASTPTGQPAAIAATPLNITKTSIKLNFQKAAKDSIAFSGTLDIPANFSSTGQKVLIDVGGVLRSFPLDTKFGSKLPNDTLKIGVKAKKGVVAAQPAKYSVSLKKGSFGPDLANENLTPDADVKKEPRTVLITLIFNNTVYRKSQALIYTARKGKSGMASSPR